MNKNILIIVTLIVILGGGFLYITRKPMAPSQSAESALNQVSTDTGNMAPEELEKELSEEMKNTENPEAVKDTKKHYKIASASSKVEFKIDEILRDKPFTAVGTTSDIAGDIYVKADNSIEMGTIKINARTFKTDSSNRDTAIARFILKSDDPKNEFITFVPKKITGKLPKVNVSGDLTISGKTMPISFDIVAGVTDGNTLSGTASGALKRSDFNLTIPSVKFVASVNDQFTISANIVANEVK
ncbi:MAG: YceI family protein [Candidatus Pacebacteria bacterium]|nr:YceI family protein [Candidatus Paceibacterota bacterium]